MRNLMLEILASVFDICESFEYFGFIAIDFDTRIPIEFSYANVNRIFACESQFSNLYASHLRILIRCDKVCIIDI